MIATARSPKRIRLSRVLDRPVARPASPAVMTWLKSNLRLPDTDMKRMKKLYDKVMSDTITRAESAELDSLMDASAAMDVLRARVLLGHGGKKAHAKAAA